MFLFCKRREFRFILLSNLLSLLFVSWQTNSIFQLQQQIYRYIDFDLRFLKEGVKFILWLKWFSFCFTFLLHLCYWWQVMDIQSCSKWNVPLRGIPLLDQIERAKILAIGFLQVIFPFYLYDYIRNSNWEHLPDLQDVGRNVTYTIGKSVIISILLFMMKWTTLSG